MSVNRLEDVLEQEMKLYQKDIKEAYRELRKYKLLEAELGIDLPTLFKALKDGIYVDLRGFIKFIPTNDLSLKFYVKRWYLRFYHPLNCGTIYVDLKGFNKTWWLEKPKEKGNG